MHYSSKGYSYEKMKKSVALCRRVEETEKKAKEQQALLCTPVMSDQEFIRREVHNRFFCGETVAVYIGLLLLTIFLLMPMIVIALDRMDSRALAITGITIFVAWFIGVTVLIFKYHNMRVSRSSLLSNYQERRAMLLENGEQLQEKYQQMQTELADMYQRLQNPACCIIPPDYQKVAETLLAYIDHGRADNLRQAMDRYDKERREAERDYLLHQTAENARRAAQDAEEAKENSEQALSEARDALFYSRMK